MATIYLNNWQSINTNVLTDSLDSTLLEYENIFDDNGDVSFDTITNKTLYGYYYGISTNYSVIVNGNHFTDAAGTAIISQMILDNASNTITIDSKITINKYSGAVAGYIHHIGIDTASGNATDITGNFGINAYGDFKGGTLTHAELIFDNNHLTLGGAITVNRFGDITGGTITSLAITDSFGNQFSASGLSLSYATLMSLSNNPADSLESLYAYMTNGNDILNNGPDHDVMRGGKGNDTYFVDDIADNVIENVNEGLDTVKSSITYELGDNLENLTLTGTDNINGTGNALKNTIVGNDGNNTLDGGDGVDKLYGGKGDDTYRVDLIQTGTTPNSYRVKLQDAVIEGKNAGTDTIELYGPNYLTHINYTTLTLGANLENLDAHNTGTILLNLKGNTADNILIGNNAYNNLNGGAGNDTLIGGAGEDTLDGSTGVDTLVGGTGDDTYIVDIVASGAKPNLVATLQDSIVELSGEGGDDTLKLRGSLTTLNTPTMISLTGSLDNIENLDISATGNTKLNIEGNSQNNDLTGNSADNILIGGAGNDGLSGEKGADTMIGGTGDDTYWVDNENDMLIENADEGNDYVFSTASFDLYTNGSNVEDITLLGKANLNVTGNDLDNEILGNDGNNKIYGGVGNDILVGEAGNDILNGGIDNDIIFGGLGNDQLLGEDGNDELYAGSGNDQLDGGAGNDYLHAGSGNDVITGGLGADTFLWSLSDHGTYQNASIDKVADFNFSEGDILDFQFLLIGESMAEDNLLNYLDFSTSTNSGITSTEIRISTEGTFANGNYSASHENAHITLIGTNLFADTGTSTEAELIQNLITNNKLIVDS